MYNLPRARQIQFFYALNVAEGCLDHPQPCDVKQSDGLPFDGESLDKNKHNQNSCVSNKTPPAEQTPIVDTSKVNSAALRI
jgi:hypothetical protein